MPKIIRLSKNVSVIETEYYIFGRKIRKKRIIFTRNYENELKKNLSCFGQDKGKEYGE